MTRKLVTLAVAALLVSIAATAQAPAAAAAPATPAATGPAPTKIGIINIQAAIMATNEGQRDFQSLDKKFEPKRTELQAANSELEKMNTQLTTQGEKLNETARIDLQKNIEAKKKNLQRAFEDAQSDYAGQTNEIGGRIAEKMMAVLEKYANENGYAVVLDVSNQQTSPVVWANATTNITKPIVDAYNAQSGVPPQPAAAPSAPKPTTGAVRAPATKPVAPKPAAPAGTTPKKP